MMFLPVGLSTTNKFQVLRDPNEGNLLAMQSRRWILEYALEKEENPENFALIEEWLHINEPSVP